MSQTLRALGAFHRFVVSDSRAVARRVLGCVTTGRTGSNTQNTQRVDIGVLTPGLLKANGAGTLRAMRGRGFGLLEYFRVAGGVS